MRFLLPAALAVALMTSSAKAEHARWFAAHYGAETCVPIDRIGDNSERLYYGEGNLREPEDVARRIRNQGGVVRISPPPIDYGYGRRGVIYEEVDRATGRKSSLLFFNDQQLCREAMDHLTSTGAIQP